MADSSELPRISDPAALKALLHPMRQEILSLLRAHGPATSTTLAERLGENTGATSYHLRQLAQHGLIEEAPELAKGRERWWRPVRVDIRWPRRAEQSPEMRAALDELHLKGFTDDLAMLARIGREHEALGDWAGGVLASRGSLDLTLDEVHRFFAEYMELFQRYYRTSEDAPPGARRVALRFLAFPELDRPS